MAHKVPLILFAFTFAAACAGTASSDLQVTSDIEAFAACTGLEEHQLDTDPGPDTVGDGDIQWAVQPVWTILAGLAENYDAAALGQDPETQRRMAAIRAQARSTGVTPAGASGFPVGLNGCDLNTPIAFSDGGVAI